jgi:hypothetical protein
VRARELRLLDHADGHALAVQQHRLQHALNAVAHRVAEVERGAQAALALRKGSLGGLEEGRLVAGAVRVHADHGRYDDVHVALEHRQQRLVPRGQGAAHCCQDLGVALCDVP